MPTSRFILCIAMVATACLAGCSAGARQGATIPAPSAATECAKFELAAPLQASSEVNAVQILFLTFPFGDSGKHGHFAGASGEGWPGDSFPNIWAFLFGPPVSRRDAESAAVYNAITRNQVDGAICTKIKSETSGFSLLGIIGYGTATANLEGHGAKLVKK